MSGGIDSDLGVPEAVVVGAVGDADDLKVRFDASTRVGDCDGDESSTLRLCSGFVSTSIVVREGVCKGVPAKDSSLVLTAVGRSTPAPFRLKPIDEL